jgi:hypothetical protein
MENKSTLINFKTIIGISLFIFTLIANIIYIWEYGEEFRLFYLLQICNLSGFLTGLALISNINEIIIFFIPWSFLPFSEFVFNFLNFLANPSKTSFLSDWAVMAGAIGFTTSLIILIKSKFSRFKYLLSGLFFVLTYISFTNYFFGINHPPDHPEIKIPLFLGFFIFNRPSEYFFL